LFYTGDKETLWWSEEHFQHNIAKAEEDGKKWHAKGYGCLLEDVYADPEHEKDKLTTFAQLPGDDYMRGAEFWLCPHLRHERRERRRNLIQAVVAKDIEIKLLGVKSPQKAEETLAILSHQLSASERKFAIRMGQADELAEKLGENPHLPMYILQTITHSSRFFQKRQSADQDPQPVVSSSFSQVVAKMAAAMGA
jgi:hypothetical protein